MDNKKSKMQELCENLASYVATSPNALDFWCNDNDITCEPSDYNTKSKAAKIDILKRIDIAAKEDSDYYPTAVSIKREFSDKAAELDALQEAGRILPEGINWPKYNDGTSVLIGDYVTVVRPGINGSECDRFSGYVLSVDIDKDGWSYVNVKCENDYRSATVTLGDTFVRCERDSWEKLNREAMYNSYDYWNCHDVSCEECNAKCGKSPREFYNVEYCDIAQRIEILERAKKLAGV